MPLRLLAIRQYFEACLPKGSLPAAILSIQTAGDMLNWNPHIHGLVASGVFRADASFVPATLIQESVLRERKNTHLEAHGISRLGRTCHLRQAG